MAIIGPARRRAGSCSALRWPLIMTSAGGCGQGGQELEVSSCRQVSTSTCGAGAEAAGLAGTGVAWKNCAGSGLSGLHTIARTPQPHDATTRCPRRRADDNSRLPGLLRRQGQGQGPWAPLLHIRPSPSSTPSSPHQLSALLSARPVFTASATACASPSQSRQRPSQTPERRSLREKRRN